MGLLDMLSISSDPVYSTREDGCSTSESVAQIWSDFTEKKRRGLSPIHSRRHPHRVKLYQLSRDYIVKTYFGSRKKVQQEISILKQLRHPGLTTYEFLVDEGSRISIVMEWAGVALRDYRTRMQAGACSEALVRHMVHQLVSSLAYLHQKGIIHRDIKPDNIGVRSNERRVCLFDWGEAVTLAEVHGLPDRELLRDVGMAGTPLFMAPEALNYLTGRGGKGADALRSVLTTKIDVWGLGCVIYFLLSGRDVFINDASWELDAIADLVSASSGLALPEGCSASPAAREFLRCCLQRDPDMRASAKELLQHPWLAAGRAVAAGAAAAPTPAPAADAGAPGAAADTTAAAAAAGKGGAHSLHARAASSVRVAVAVASGSDSEDDAERLRRACAASAPASPSGASTSSSASAASREARVPRQSSSSFEAAVCEIRLGGVRRESGESVAG